MVSESFYLFFFYFISFSRLFFVGFNSYSVRPVSYGLSLYFFFILCLFFFFFKTGKVHGRTDELWAAGKQAHWLAVYVVPTFSVVFDAEQYKMSHAWIPLGARVRLPPIFHFHFLGQSVKRAAAPSSHPAQLLPPSVLPPPLWSLQMAWLL